MFKQKLMRASVFALLLALCLPSSATPPYSSKTATDKTTTAQPQIKYEKYKLKNGLDVILSEDHRIPMVAVNLWYHVGPANERPGRTGFAHLFEHMMFEGSKHTTKGPFGYLEAAGASDINGTTDFDRTNYFETLPSNQVELALWLESDRMGYLLDGLDHERLANQRDVVRNERRQSVENAPYGLVEEAVFHQLYPKEHPYYGSVIGSHGDIEAARLNDVRDFLKQYYTPNNASLVIVGDIDPAKTKAMVEKYFGPIPAGPPVPKITATTPPITSERRATVTDQIELPRVYMAWIGVPIYKPGDAELDLIAQALGGGKSSRLYKDLVYDKQIAQDVQAQNQSLLLGSVFEIQATAKPGVKPEDLEKAINDDLEKFRSTGPTQEELERARNTVEESIIGRLETLGGFGGVADRLNSYNQFLGDPGFLPRDLQRYDNADVAALMKVTKDKLSDNQRVVVYGVPGKKVIEDVPKTAADVEAQEAKAQPESRMPEAAWRKDVPKPGPIPSIALPQPASFKMANGMTVYLVERHNLPIVTAGVTIISGSDANPTDKPGLASFTADMLDEGTENRSALKVADDVAQIGAALQTRATMDASFASIQSLSKNLDSAFDLLSDVTLHPAFAPKEIDRVRSQRITEILQQHDEPGVLARKTMYRVLYGPQHPYGYLDSGTEASNKAIVRDDLVNFWKGGYVPSNTALVVAGDVSKEQLQAVAEKYFGKWSGTAQRHSAPEAVAVPTGRTVVIVDKPGAPQTAIRVATIGTKRSSPDYVPLEVMNLALGGTFSSRINLNLREKHGYTYGAFSNFAFRRSNGPFAVGSGIRTDVTGPAVGEVMKEITAISQSEISPTELELSRGQFALSLPGRFETTPNTVDAVSDLFVYDLPLDYYRTLPEKINAVTPADVQRVAKQYIKPDAMVIVAVGDRAKIEPELKKLDLGTIEVRDFEANPVKVAAASAQ